MADLGNGEKGLEAAEKAHAGPQDRNYRELGSGNPPADSLAYRSLNRIVLERKVAGYLVAHKEGNLVEKLAEILGTGIRLTHD